MLDKPPRRLFVTGTSTEAGKTFVASLIARALVKAGRKVGVYKPAASDCIRVGDEVVSEDAVALWEAAGHPLTLDAVCPQRFRAALAPHLAAKSEGKEIDPLLLRKGLSVWKDQCEIAIVEGSGGLMSPMGDHEFVAEIAADIGYPLIIVVPNVLGCINYTMQTLIAAACYGDGLKVAGIVLTDPEGFEGDMSTATNRGEIERRSVAPVLAQVPFGGDDFDTQVDWFALAK